MGKFEIMEIPLSKLDLHTISDVDNVIKFLNINGNLSQENINILLDYRNEIE